ncbi:RHS repeat-associated core domain-containing protein [Brevibacillus fluminis]|uniref:RHS repeat-associated core domain-containing protein n=1 Tax=Brevibacillus fluminis TaxID=511487 RepID=UPI003F8CE150
MTEVDQNGTLLHYRYDKIDRLIEEGTPTGTKNYTYDPRGNRKTLTGNVPAITDANLTYDGRNRLQSFSNKAGDSASYKYFGDGLLATKLENGKETNYVYLNGKVIEEIDENGTVKARNIWGNQLILRKDYASQNAGYYLFNSHGDVVSIVNEKGAALNTYAYDAWGNILSKTEGMSNPFTYSGEVYDAKTGLYYLRARYYDPSVGRFISEDTYKGQVDNPLSLNRYAYVENNPLKFIDPTGHWSTGVTANWTINEMKWQYDKAKTDSDRKYWANQAESLRDRLRAAGYAESDIMQGSDYMIPEDVVNKIAWDVTIKKIESDPYGFGLFVHSADAIQYAPLGGAFAGSLKIVRTATSVIKNDKRLVRAAMEMGKDPRVQSEADNLVKSFLSGNTNPGKGSKSLGFGGIYEMRGANGARVYFKNVESGIEIVGKSNKANQADVIKVLRDLYGK